MSHLAIARLSLSAELPTERSKYLWHTGAKLAVLIPRAHDLWSWADNPSKSRLSISTRATERDLKCWWEVHASKHSLLQANLIQSEVGHPWSSYVSELTQVPSATLRSVVSRCLQGAEVINPMLSPFGYWPMRDVPKCAECWSLEWRVSICQYVFFPEMFYPHMSPYGKSSQKTPELVRIFPLCPGLGVTCLQ